MREIDDAVWYIKYIDFIYFAFITAMIVGYGDITP